MPKTKPHHIHKKYHPFGPLNFLAIALLITAVCVSVLRSNNEHMVELRSDVYQADRKNTNVVGALQNLQAYVTTHMNTNLSTGNGSVYPPIQLKYTYQRLLNNESANAAQANLQLYTDAQNYCQAQIPSGFSGRYRVPCIEQYVQNHDNSLPAVPASQYKFDFVSPAWSPDLAGWSALAAIVAWLVFAASLIYNRLNKLQR